MFTITRSRAFRSFQRKVGNSTFHLNSAYVGLELIARGASKPDDVKIKWSAPKIPKEAVAQSRSFLYTAALIYVFGAVDRYLRELANDEWFNFAKPTRDILIKAKTKKGDEAYSISDRFAVIFMPKTVDAATDGFLLNLLVILRNQLIHGDLSSTKARLDEGIALKLRDHSANAYSRYGGLKLELLVDHIKKKQSPSRKDTIALVSSAQNFIRAVDSSLVAQTFQSAENIEHIALKEICRAMFIDGCKRLRSTWGNDVKVRERRIVAILEEAGFSRTGCITPSLSTNFVPKLAMTPVEQVTHILQEINTHLIE